MVSVGEKEITSRAATAKGSIIFANSEVASLIKNNALKKGDVLSVARIAGIMAAKRTSELIPLCHPIAITNITVELHVVEAEHDTLSRVDIIATVKCDGKTGVEMEALSAVSVAALTVYDMCKAVDRGMKIDAVRVVSKSGGRSGDWKVEE
jgi:molybdenum cofactor biosynthesis protein MoaC